MGAFRTLTTEEVRNLLPEDKKNLLDLPFTADSLEAALNVIDEKIEGKFVCVVPCQEGMALVFAAS